MGDAEDDDALLKTSRLKSVVWNDFDRVKRGDTYVAICRHCKRILNGSSTSGTSHLRNHLIRCRKRTNQDITQFLTRAKGKQGPPAITSYNNTKNDMVTVARTSYEQGLNVGCMMAGNLDFDYKQSQLDLTRMIIMHGYPLSIVEDIGFRTFVQNLHPLFDLATVNRVESDCMEIYRKEKLAVYEELDKLPGKVSLSGERWTGNANEEYLCLIAHYIDDSWELKRRVLSFSAINHSESEESLSEVIMMSLRSWDIDRKLFSLTVDNHSSYDKMASRIIDQLCQHKFLICDGELFDIRCAANTVKLLVQDVLVTSSEIIDKVRETIRFTINSKEAQEKFDEIVQLVGIKSQRVLFLDQPLQWNLTYLMLETALEYKEAFSHLHVDGSGLSMQPSCIDWDRLRAITSILKLFHEVANVFVGSRNLTANSYFSEICDIYLQLIEWCHKSDEFVSSLAVNLKSKFDEYWKKCSLIMAIAAILDPRFKMKLVEYYYPQIYGDTALDCIDIVSNCMKALYNGHAIYTPLASSDGQCSNSQSDTSVVRDKLVGFDQFLHANQHIKSDLDKYLEEPLFPRSNDFSVLNWWKVHEPRYPVLSMVARNILGIPISKGAVESVFNFGERVLNHFWSSLKPDTLQALVCSQDWINCQLEG